MFQSFSLIYLHIISQIYIYHLTSKLNSKTVELPSLDPSSLIFPFHLLPSPVHPTGFSFCIFPGFLAIFILMSSSNNICMGIYYLIPMLYNYSLFNNRFVNSKHMSLNLSPKSQITRVYLITLVIK